MRDDSRHASLVSILGDEIEIQMRPNGHYGTFRNHYSYKDIYFGNKNRNSHFAFRCMDTENISVVTHCPSGLGTSTNRIPVTDDILAYLLEDIKGIIANIAQKPVEFSIDHVTKSNYE